MASLAHARGVVLTRRLSALFAMLALLSGNVALCAGWQDSADARMACCHREEPCPMDGSDQPPGSAIHGDHSQAAADQCCAAVEQHRSADARGALPQLSPLHALSHPTAAVAHVAAAGLMATSPPPVQTVPIHLRLTVLLV